MNTHRLACVLPLVLWLALATEGRAQVQWTQGGSWPLTVTAASVYDSARDRIVAYDAQLTYEFDGTSWSAVQTPQVPTAIPWQSLVYDRSRQRVLMLNVFREAWEYDGTTWMLMATNCPNPLGLVYHDVRGKVVAFGDDDPVTGASSTDLREWDGVSWRLIPATNQPPSGSNPWWIYYSTMSYDAARDRLCVFGARHVGPGLPPPGMYEVADTWEWDVVNGWQWIAAGGPANLAISQVYDSSRATQVLISAQGQGNLFTTWERSGGNWTQRDSRTGYYWGSLVFDSTRNRCVMPGGDSLTSIVCYYGPVTPARYAPHGGGCAGSQGEPTLSLAHPWTLPWLGGALVADLQPLPAGAAFLATGLQDQSIGSQPLPLDLAPIGMTQCLLRIAPMATLPLSGPSGTARFSVTVPNAAGLLGQPFYQQALVLDPTANAPGLILSQSMRGMVGSR